RIKTRVPGVDPIRGVEMRALRKLRRDYPRAAYVFVSERGGPMSPIGFHRLIQPVGEAAKAIRSIHTCCAMPVGSSSPLGHKNSTPKWRPTGSRTFGEADLTLGHLGAAASGRRQARHRFPLYHLGICPCFPLGDHLLDNLNSAFDLLVGHGLDTAGMLEFQLFRDEHGADLQ